MSSEFDAPIGAPASSPPPPPPASADGSVPPPPPSAPLAPAPVPAAAPAVAPAPQPATAAAPTALPRLAPLGTTPPPPPAPASAAAPVPAAAPAPAPAPAPVALAPEPSPAPAPNTAAVAPAPPPAPATVPTASPATPLVFPSATPPPIPAPAVHVRPTPPPSTPPPVVAAPAPAPVPAPVPAAAAAPAGAPAPVAAPEPSPAPAPEPSPTAAAPAAATAARHDLSDILAQLETDDGTAGLEQATSVPEVGTKLTDARDLERPDTTSDVVIEMSGGLDFDPTFASFARRAVGFCIDHLIVTAAALPGLYLARPGTTPGGKILGLAIMSVALIIVFVVSGRAVAHKTQWIGNRITGTRVVNAVNGSNVTRSYAMTRNFLRHLISPLLLAGFIVAFFDSQRRTFHDRFAGSVVIGRSREVWTADSGPNDRKSSN